MRKHLVLGLLCFALALLVEDAARGQETVEAVMDGLVARLYAEKAPEALYALTPEEALAALTPQERETLATKHWYFDVNVPVVVSLMHNVEQAVAPFWLAESGFKKTEMMVTNMEGWKYEVWQKSFPAGRVALGINGFDNFRPHYFVCVGPQEAGKKVEITHLHPADDMILEMKAGALTYHDWTELVLTEVPEALLGQQLLPTIRGRGREAALVGAFRETPFPSSAAPGPIFLTWSDDPKTTQNIQWRTSTEVAEGAARIREKGSGGDFVKTPAVLKKMEDRMLANDRVCHWFTAVARGLKPGTAYEYQVGSPEKKVWSETHAFTTAPAEEKPFTFFWCSDTHSNPKWGAVLKETFERFPQTAFTTISGDLVGTGLEREDWDETLTYGQPAFQSSPVMPAIGNHDAQLGLGAGMYLDIFGLPENGPKGISPEAAYTFSYSNAQFFVLDVMSESQPQHEWLKKELASSTAKWKIAVFHFPLYSNEEAYPHLVAAWGTLFDEYHVDLVLSGHIHTHLRTFPMKGGQRVGSTKEGTIYATTVSIPSRPARGKAPENIEALVGGGLLCDVIDVGADSIRLRAFTTGGEVKDEFEIKK